MKVDVVIPVLNEAHVLEKSVLTVRGLLDQQFAATGTYSDNSTQDLTTTATWSSSNNAVAPISNAAGTEGLANGATAGTVTITATFGGVAGTTQLTVTSATLVSTQVTPPPPPTAKGTAQQFVAQGT